MELVGGLDRGLVGRSSLGTRKLELGDNGGSGEEETEGSEHEEPRPLKRQGRGCPGGPGEGVGSRGWGEALRNACACAAELWRVAFMALGAGQG